MNVELIKQVVKRIEHDEDSFDMRNWVAKFYGQRVDYWGREHAYLPYELKAFGLNDEQLSACKTRFCFAGHALVEAGILTPDGREINEDGSTQWDPKYDYVDRAANVLGLDGDHALEIFMNTDIRTVAELKEQITRTTGITFED